MLEILNRLEFFKDFSSYEKRKTIDMKIQFLIFKENEFLVKEGSSKNAERLDNLNDIIIKSKI